MEIRTYLRAIRRWLWLPLGLPVIAAMITGVILETQPLKFQAEATVIVPAVSAKGFSTSAAAQYVATFQDVLISSPVVSKVAADTHVPATDLVAGLSASTTTASSNIIHVDYLGYKGQNVTQVVNQAAILSLDTIAEPQLIQAENAVTAAQTQLQQADGALTDFTATTGQISPQQQFNSLQQELNQLLLELQQAQIAGDSAHATALQQAITQRQQQLATLAPQVTNYSSLSDARQAALTVRDHSAQELNDAQALLAADHNPSTVAAEDLGRVSRLSTTLKFVAIGFVVALVLALGLILLMELMRGSRVPEEAQLPEMVPALSAIGGADQRMEQSGRGFGGRPMVGARRPPMAPPLRFGGGTPSNGNGHDRDGEARSGSEVERADAAASGS